MQDIEIESLIREAGYLFVPASGRYMVIDSADDDIDYPTEDVSDQLEIPVDDLIRWEQEQVAAESSES